MEIPEECLDIPVMKLMLQPIVENCYFHGFTDKTKAYHILIKGERQERTLFLSVEDNGCGISQEKLAQIKDRLSAVCHNAEYMEKETDSIALDNIMGRLWTIYGEDADMGIESNPGSGTRVILRLPIQEA